ncbi:hypothetical protein BDN71DRAFT_1436570 [Pleurotus eryngii]|uniref:Uncharacterized protein n=1 Tax=Pleurotus eryngii TaxID=5323 RepID=A0A9P6D1T0_PLEER|nr:hypothetical protein BDN71DRAFT_1436570 [Pleurotus eryngii]
MLTFVNSLYYGKDKAAIPQMWPHLQKASYRKATDLFLEFTELCFTLKECLVAALPNTVTDSAASPKWHGEEDPKVSSLRLSKHSKDYNTSDDNDHPRKVKKQHSEHKGKSQPRWHSSKKCKHKGKSTSKKCCCQDFDSETETSGSKSDSGSESDSSTEADYNNLSPSPAHPKKKQRPEVRVSPHRAKKHVTTTNKVTPSNKVAPSKASLPADAGPFPVTRAITPDPSAVQKDGVADRARVHGDRDGNRDGNRDKNKNKNKNENGDENGNVDENENRNKDMNKNKNKNKTSGRDKSNGQHMDESSSSKNNSNGSNHSNYQHDDRDKDGTSSQDEDNDDSSSNSDPNLPTPNDTAEWFIKQYDEMCKYHLGDDFADMLAMYIELEAANGYADSQYSLPAQGCLSEIDWWVGRGCWCAPNIMMPAEAYAKCWQNKLQPKWCSIAGKTCSPGAKNHHLASQSSESWEVLDHPGANGFLSIVTSLAWWGILKGAHSTSWSEAVAEVMMLMKSVHKWKAAQ